MNERAKGYLLTAGGIMALSPDALIIKLSGLPAPAMIFWRGALVGLTLTLVLALFWRARTLRQFRAIGKAGVLVTVFYAISNSCFTAANTYTYAANVLVIVATTPLFSAIFASLFLKEHSPPRVWIASAVAMIGVALVAGEQVSLNAGLGELFALVCVLGISITFVVIRSARAINMLPATALALLITVPLGLPFYEEPATQIGWIAILAGGFFFIPVAYVGLTIGPRYLPPSEVGLLLLLETVFGSLWVWLVLKEAPTELGVIGGVIILAALIGNTLLGLRRERRIAA
ncbi:MAG: DMT family transporter [Minwuia sp.]|uniref:DMT family transporter n=1 Tax=Minwuia sp. TaxID=2493630 RepID=UPI003A870918